MHTTWLLPGASRKNWTDAVLCKRCPTLGWHGHLYSSKEDSLGAGHCGLKFCIIPLSSYLFLRSRGWDTVACFVELGVSRACEHQCVWGGVGDGEHWGFFNLHFLNSFLLCSPRRQRAEWSKHLTFVKCLWSGPDREGDIWWQTGSSSKQEFKLHLCLSQPVNRQK